MDREWFSPAEIVAARSPELPGTVQNLNRIAQAEGWRADASKAMRGAKGGGWLYHISLLPMAAQTRLLLQHRAVEAATPVPNDAVKTLWDRFNGLSSEQKDECKRRLDAVTSTDRYQEAGLSASAAAALSARDANVSRATLYNWQKMTAGFDRADWLAALAPASTASAAFSQCHPEAYEALKADYLRLEKPAFSACYRRTVKLAKENGWLPMPSERALRRRVDAEVSKATQTLARSGSKKAKALYPAQTRTRATLHAMEAVNMDGHELDVFVRTPDGRILRMHLLALQDLYSGKIVAWRLSETENKETVRLVIGDMVERHGIPYTILLDNGRAFASKWISGGTANRYRFKVRDEDPQGLLTTLGVKIIWAKPYSGQSKPIERAFRDLAENIAKHPLCTGAYTGNRPEAKPENYGSKAMPLDEFRAHVAREIADHNARPGRTLETCGRRSFDETFAASMAADTTLVKWPTEAQRSLWLLASDSIRARKGSGEIHFYGNRYWSPELNQHAGAKVIVRFDPDRLQEGLQVYSLDDRLICAAKCIQATGFFDQDAARTHARDRGAYEKALKEQRRLIQKMSVDELARLYQADKPAPVVEPVQPKVKRVAVAGGRAPEVVEDFEQSFSRGMRALGIDADVIPFTPRSSGSG